MCKHFWKVLTFLHWTKYMLWRNYKSPYKLSMPPPWFASRCLESPCCRLKPNRASTPPLQPGIPSLSSLLPLNPGSTWFSCRAYYMCDVCVLVAVLRVCVFVGLLLGNLSGCWAVDGPMLMLCCIYLYNVCVFHAATKLCFVVYWLCCLLQLTCWCCCCAGQGLSPLTYGHKRYSVMRIIGY